VPGIDGKFSGALFVMPRRGARDHRVRSAISNNRGQEFSSGMPRPRRYRRSEIVDSDFHTADSNAFFRFAGNADARAIAGKHCNRSQ